MRENYWDFLKGICILAVMYIHATSVISTSPHGSFEYNFSLVTRQFVCFAVPLFLAFAGYMAGGKPIKSAIFFWKSRFFRLLAPYLFWTTVYILLKPESFQTIYKLFSAYAAGTGLGIGYYVIVLCQMVILTPLLWRIRSFAAHAAIILGMTILGLSFTYGMHFGAPESLFARFPASGLPFFVWYPFYHIGFLAGRGRWEETQWLRKRAKALLIFWLGLVIVSIGEGIWLSSQGLDGLAVSQTKVSSIFGSIFLFLSLLALFHKYKNAGPNAFAWLGRNSYFFYLFHLLAFDFIGRVLPLSGIVQPFVLVLGGILICSLACVLGRKVFQGKLQEVILG